ncbi:adenylate kinase [Patescibacteria group bacterium]|nr:adenylate kinase [Patescibacteria group bacterium]
MNIIFLGPQSCGKGTQAELLSEKLNISIVTTGNIFRSKKASGDEEGKLIASYIDKGNLVPDELTDKIVRDELQKEEYQNGVILDGYPRNLNQAEELDKYFRVDKVIFLNVPDAIVLKRMSNRRICEKCGANFNLISKSPKEGGKCDSCGSNLIQREDDTEEVIAVRLNSYHRLTEPLIDYYEKQRKLIRIDGTKTIEGVHEEVMKHVTRNT